MSIKITALLGCVGKGQALLVFQSWLCVSVKTKCA